MNVDTYGLTCPTMVSFHQIGAKTQKMCAESLNKKFSLKFLIKLKLRTNKPSKKFRPPCFCLSGYNERVPLNYESEEAECIFFRLPFCI